MRGRWWLVDWLWRVAMVSGSGPRLATRGRDGVEDAVAEGMREDGAEGLVEASKLRRVSPRPPIEKIPLALAFVRRPHELLGICGRAPIMSFFTFRLLNLFNYGAHHSIP